MPTKTSNANSVIDIELVSPPEIDKNSKTVLTTSTIKHAITPPQNSFTKWVSSPEELLKLINRYENIIAKHNTRSKINIYEAYKLALTQLASQGNQRKLTM